MAMDPVNKKALKKDWENRKDKDIDNDGDTDQSDIYLHKRRQAVTKAIKNVKESYNIDEKMLTPAEKKKREEIAKAMERDNPDMPMDKKMAIATSQAKKVAEAKKPDAAEMMQDRAKNKRISSSDKDKLKQISDMMRKANDR